MPLINQKIIDDFLARELGSFDFIKREKCLPVPSTHLVGEWQKLWLHQQACFTLIDELKKFIVHIGMGGGKSLLALSILRHRKRLGEQIKAIVFVPYITSVETWVEEVAKHTPDLVCTPLVGTGVSNLTELASGPGGADLYVICYQSAVAMLALKAKDKWLFDPQRVKETFAGFNMVVFDEIHKCRNIHSLTYKMSRVIANQSEWALGLTGTPFGKDIADIWPQFNLIDQGETLGRTLTLFREAFFTKKINYWGGYEYKFQQAKMPLLKRFIKNRSITYNVDEFADMPPKSYLMRKLTLPEGAQGYSSEALKEMREIIKAKGDYQLLSSKYLQLQQLGSGFMTLLGEDNNKLYARLDENPKLDVLEEMIDATPLDDKLVVFHHFVYTSSLICARLKSLKVGHTAINGTVRDPIERLRTFKQDPKCRVLVINSRSGSSSLNLQNANCVIFFEQPLSAIDRQQAEARCWRSGQEKRVFFFDLIMQGTLDGKQHHVNKTGENLLKELLGGRIKLDA